MKRSAKLSLTAAALASVWLACDVTDIHIFVAGQYIAGMDCVTPGYAVDVLNGPATDANCEASCVVLPFDSGVFVTGACAPFPEGDKVGDASPLCPKALAAIRRSDLCLEGGPSNPLTDANTPPAPPDAAPEVAPAEAGDARAAGDAS